MTALGDHGTRLHARVQPAADRSIVTLSGELDKLAGPLLAELLCTVVVDSGSPHVEVDLAQVGFLDIAGLRVLLHAHQFAADRGIVFSVRNPHPHICWLLQATGTADRLLADGDAALAVAASHWHPPSPPPTHPPASPAGETSAPDPQETADDRERLADDRERLADDRERLADDRERLADERANLLEERAHRVDEHERWEDIREDQANAREQHLNQREHDQ